MDSYYFTMLSEAEKISINKRNIDSVEGLMNKYAADGWRLHTMMTAPTKDAKTQLTTMVFERNV